MLWMVFMECFVALLMPLCFGDKIITKQSATKTKQDKSCVVGFPSNILIPIECYEARERKRKHAKAIGYSMRSCIQDQQSLHHANYDIIKYLSNDAHIQKLRCPYKNFGKHFDLKLTL